MRILTIDDFSRRVGQTFAVRVKGGQLGVKLDQVQPLPATSRPGGAFRLEFLGPGDPMLVQATYIFQIDRDDFEIFVVPIGRGAEGVRYEALFL